MFRLTAWGVPTLALVLATSLACTPSGPQGPVVPKPTPTPAELVGTPLATVNGQQVGSAGWQAVAERRAPADGATWTDEEKTTLLQQAIDEEVLFQEAFGRALYHDPKVRRILINMLLRQEVYEQVAKQTFSDDEVRKYFDEHAEDFVIPEKAQIRRIFVTVEGQRTEAEAKAIADQAYAKVKANPDSFRDVAMQVSEDAFAKRGGDLGFVDRNGRAGIPPELVERAFTLDEGAITEPFLAAGGFNVIQVPAKRERIEREFEQMKGAATRRLKNERSEELAKQFVAGLREKAQVVVDDKTVSGWTAPAPEKALPPGVAADGALKEAPVAPITAPDPSQPGADAAPEPE